MRELIDLLKSINSEIDWEKSNCLVTSGILDSLAVVEIINAVEEHYNIELVGDDIDVINFESVDSILKMIEKY